MSNRQDKLRFRLCPHWYRTVPDYGDQIMMDVTKQERCRVCGKRRVHARVPEPHPTRDKEDLKEKLQHPGYEVVIEEWLPAGSKGP